ncbi:beta-lactamase/transpeptidase-like protein [Panus rudis PR-1116 ss-1]|nr:beta-lactamase/transpeptidase-like protein [Panus rudis PR-1116 ss-1]
MLYLLALLATLVVGQQSPLPLAASEHRHAISDYTLQAKPDLSDYVTEILSKGSIPGLALGVVYPNGTVEHGAWGVKTEDGVNTTTDAFLASSIGILMDDFANGRNATALPVGIRHFDWYTTITDLLPDDWKLLDEWAHSKANIRDVLSHVSGLPRHDYTYKPGDSALDVVQRMRHLKPAFELRQRWSYNNQASQHYMYILVAHLIAKYSGISYPEFVKARIFDPLNMTSSTFSPSDAARTAKLTQSWTRFRRLIPFWFSDEIAEMKAGPGGVISNVVDLTNWLQMLLNEGLVPGTNETIIPRNVFDEMTTAHAVVSGRAPSPESSLAGYGLGWSVSSYKGHEIVSHSGGIPGFSTMISFLPSDGLGIVVLTNADEKYPYILELARHIIDNTLGLSSSAAVASPANPPASQVTPIFSSTAQNIDSLETFTGTYTDAGYGNLTLCAASSQSSHCQAVLDSFSPFEPDDKSSRLYAAFSSVWSSHIRLIHGHGDTWNITFTYLFPHGYGKDTSPFETFETGSSQGMVQFVTKGKSEMVGFGLFLVHEVTMRRRIGGTVEDIADVWFRKVDSDTD